MTTEPQGTVLWLTGLSASGKTTIARRLGVVLRKKRIGFVHLDGDTFREVIGDQLGHDRTARLENALRLARMCRLLATQGVHVVCSTMSLFPEVWEWNRVHLANYFEVYLRVDLEALKKRDPKGIYRRAQVGEERDVVGFDLPFEEPSAPDLVIENHIDGDKQISEVVSLLLSHFPRPMHNTLERP